MATLRVNPSSGWTVQRVPVRSSRSLTRGGVDPQAGFPSKFLTAESEVAEEVEARPQAATRARGAAPGPLDVECDLGPGEAAVLSVRHPSGALTFHRPVQATSRSRGGPARVRFVVPMPSAARPTATRGVVSRAAKAFLIKVAGKVGDTLASLVLSKLVAHVESAAWKKRGLSEGWLAVTKGTLETGKLRPGRPSSGERSLLLIHGTFSNAASAYAGLARSNFFERVKPIYGDRIFAFDHFSLSRTPEENVRMLLEGLPEGPFTFDVITHSRGGLVLRNLAERATAFKSLAKRFKLGRAVLVASPNEGTPLATPGRWEDTVGWMANLLELFPVDNPFTTGAEFVANGIVWIARHASGDIPGLHSMDGDGELIADLQQPPGPSEDVTYSALVANYNPSEKVLLRMIDAGLDGFFGSANDLVVPSEGGWRVDREGSTFIPGERIGCFGPGGNLPGDAVTHIGFFSEPAAVEFLVTALAGDAHTLPVLDPAKSLPDRRLLRAGGAGVAAPTSAVGRRAPVARRSQTGGGGHGARGARARATEQIPTLRVTVVNGDLTFERLPLLIGHYHATELTGTERVMNAVIGRALEEALALGDYPIETGTNRVFVNRHVVEGKPWLPPRPRAVIVVGLGQEGSLRGADLTHTVTQGVIAWARHVDAEAKPGNGAAVELAMAATLIGSGGSGITTGQAAQLIAQGVYEANERLFAMDRTWPRVGHLRFLELYLDRASEALRALKMHALAAGRYTIAEFVERGTGPLPRPLEAGYRGAAYDFITAETHTNDQGEVQIAYALDTKRARTEIRAVTPQGRLVRDLVSTASSEANEDPQIGATLFKLLVPIDLESFLKTSTDMQIELDEGTAGIPWELLDDAANRPKGVEPWAIRTKLLRKLRTRTFRGAVNDATSASDALVIGEPQCPDDYGRLLGARDEALEVVAKFSKLSKAGVSGIKPVISDDPATPGADARTVVNALFERDWRIVHIAGHGALPEGSNTGGVVLSNGTFIGPAEIAAMRVVPELVFINCCHLGASPSASVLADGRSNPSVYDRARFASSVARALIDVGVRCVIAAGWAVDDAAAKEFAGVFYERLLAGARFIEAVADARRAAFQYASNTWAAYQCYGDPEWRLQPDGGGGVRSTPEQEFEGVTSVAMLKLALETLYVQKTYQGFDANRQLARVRSLEHRWSEAGWKASDGVAELFARVYAATGGLQEAIGWYDRAIAVADGNVSLRALEQRANLQVRQAWKTLEAAHGRSARSRKPGAKKRKRAAGRGDAYQDARATIDEALKVLDELMTIRPTAERANLCGSAMKRLALVEAAAGRLRQELQAIERMKAYYERGQELTVQDGLRDLFYPASNYIAAELALNAGRKGWKVEDRSLFEATRKSLADKNEDDPDFWSVVGQIDVDLYQALEETNLAAVREQLEARYRDLHTRMRGGTDWGSVYDTAAFVLLKYRTRATPAEGRAADALLATLAGFVPPPANTRKPARGAPKPRR